MTSHERHALLRGIAVGLSMEALCALGVLGAWLLLPFIAQAFR